MATLEVHPPEPPEPVYVLTLTPEEAKGLRAILGGMAVHEGEEHARDSSRPQWECHVKAAAEGIYDALGDAL